eukprot:6197752-Prymnesium_polylepis.2
MAARVDTSRRRCPGSMCVWLGGCGGGGVGERSAGCAKRTELGRRLDDEIGAELDGAHDDGRGEGGVDDVRDALALRERAHRRDVGERQRRVGGRLGEDELRVRLDVLLDVGDVGEVDEIELHAHVGEHGAARAVGAAVRAVGDHAM